MAKPALHAPQSTTEALRLLPHSIVVFAPPPFLTLQASGEAQRCSTVSPVSGAEVSYQNESLR